MTGKQMKETLAKGGRVYGVFFQYTTNPAIVEVMPDEGLDFVIVNAEHNALDLADFLGIQFALKSKGIACLARIHSRDPEDVAKACDSFHDGVVVPYTEDVDELKRLVGAAKYRPLKGEALRGVLEEGRWPSEKTRQYVEEKCANTFFCAMTESAHSMENLEALCQVPDIDAFLIGPNDLSTSMGIPEERDNPEFIDAIQRFVDMAQGHGIAAGAHFSELKHAKRLIEQGGRFIPFSSDLRVIQAGIPDFLSQLRSDIKGSAGEKII